MNPTRRTFLTTSLATLFAAPAVVRAASLMPVRDLSRFSDVFPLRVEGWEIGAPTFVVETSVDGRTWSRATEPAPFLDGQATAITNTMLFGQSFMRMSIQVGGEALVAQTVTLALPEPRPFFGPSMGRLLKNHPSV